MNGHADDSLKLPDEAELQLVDVVRRRLRAKLGDDSFNGLPDDFCDDLQITRFLRGHNADLDKIVALMLEAIEYRKGLLQQDRILAMRKAAAESDLPDLQLLPHAAEMLPMNPLFVVGSTVDGLPIMATCPRLLDFDLLSECLESKWEEYEAFLQAMLEQRAIVLHHLSRKQNRMAKFMDLRDLNQLSVTQLLTRAYAFLAKLKGFLSVVQDYYPEIIHQVVCFNAPNGLKPLFDLLSSFMNERMMSKIKILPIGESFHPAAQMLQAKAISTWVSEVACRLCWYRMCLANGAQEYCTRWLEAGATCTYSVTLHEGGDLKLLQFFIPVDGLQASELEQQEITLSEDGATHTSSVTRNTAGVLWLCVDNSEAWWNSRTFTLTIDGGAVGLPAPATPEKPADFLG